MECVVALDCIVTGTGSIHDAIKYGIYKHQFEDHTYL